MIRTCMLVVVALASGCSKPPEVPATSFEVPAPPVAPVVIATAAAPRRAIDRECEASVRLGEMTKSTPTCELDEHVSTDAGVLTWPCTGDGVASIQFGKARFEGVVHDGLLEVNLTTSFPFADGCQWQSRQTITGGISPGSLRYRYAEVPTKASPGCWSACSASAPVAVGEPLRGGPSLAR